jgi:hypothetical protein
MSQKLSVTGAAEAFRAIPNRTPESVPMAKDLGRIDVFIFTDT